MDELHLSVPDVAKALGVHEQTVVGWRNDKYFPRGAKERALEELLRKPNGWLRFGDSASADRVSESRAPYGLNWPAGWQARAHRLAAEAAEAGASEEEIAVVRGWMMDPQLQLLWSGGAPKELKELDGIEIGARAWLRARGRKVAKDVPASK